MMKFIALTSTADTRLTKGNYYYGGFVMVQVSAYCEGNLRIVVFDNLKTWVTFDPKVFKPYE